MASRTQNSIRNVFAAWGGQALLAVSQFVVRAVFVACLAQEYVGLETLFASVLTVLTLADLGVGSAIVFALYEPLAKGDREAIKTLMRLFKRAITDCESEVRYDPEHKKGVSNLMTIYSAATGRTFAEIEAEFAGRGYGDFKKTVGEAVVELLRPIREESQRLLADKAYLQSVCESGAQKAACVAEKTLRKVYKKVGFVAR